MVRNWLSRARILRKRTIFGLVFSGLLIIGVIVSLFLFQLKQERELSAVDPVSANDETLAQLDDGVVQAESFFDPADGVKEIEVKQIHDTQRRENLQAIHRALQEYRRNHGRYPRLTQMNSEGFRNSTFSELTTDTFQDPDDNTHKVSITRTPQEAVYAYDVVNEDGYTCEPGERVCVAYTLMALLSDGSVYSISSDD